MLSHFGQKAVVAIGWAQRSRSYEGWLVLSTRLHPAASNQLSHKNIRYVAAAVKHVPLVKISCLLVIYPYAFPFVSPHLRFWQVLGIVATHEKPD